MTHKQVPEEVFQAIQMLSSVWATRLFHKLKKRNPKASDRTLTNVVLFAAKYARKQGYLCTNDMNPHSEFNPFFCDNCIDKAWNDRKQW